DRMELPEIDRRLLAIDADRNQAFPLRGGGRLADHPMALHRAARPDYDRRRGPRQHLRDPVAVIVAAQDLVVPPDIDAELSQFPGDRRRDWAILVRVGNKDLGHRT